MLPNKPQEATSRDQRNRESKAPRTRLAPQRQETLGRQRLWLHLTCHPCSKSSARAMGREQTFPGTRGCSDLPLLEGAASLSFPT